MPLTPFKVEHGVSSNIICNNSQLPLQASAPQCGAVLQKCIQWAVDPVAPNSEHYTGAGNGTWPLQIVKTMDAMVVASSSSSSSTGSKVAWRKTYTYQVNEEISDDANDSMQYLLSAFPSHFPTYATVKKRTSCVVGAAVSSRGGKGKLSRDTNEKDRAKQPLV